MRNFFGVTTDDLFHLKPLKCVRKNAICFTKIILVQDFCPLKIKITQCPGGFTVGLKCSRNSYSCNGITDNIYQERV